MEQYLILSNVLKSNGCSIGTLIRSASAFNVKEIILVGYAKYGTHGAHGANKHVAIHLAATFAEAQSYLRLKKECDTIYGIVGYPLTEELPCIELKTHAFPSRACAFVLGNETSELSRDQRDICTAGYLYIGGRDGCPHASLDVNVSLAIVLHTFAVQAGFPERAFRASSTQGKFELNETQGYAGPTPAHRAVAAQREQRRNEDATDSCEPLDLLFE